MRIYRRTPLEERFWKYAKDQGDCIVWTGCVKPNGYGAFFPSRREKTYAHRWAYERYVGPIPKDMVIDHLCRNRRCVNPLHLEAVTQWVNNLRGETDSVRNMQKTHCKRGHELSLENLLKGRAREGRICKICHRERERRYRDEAHVRDGL